MARSRSSRSASWANRPVPWPEDYSHRLNYSEDTVQLFYSATSPFARKVRVVIAELGLTGIDLVTVSPFDRPAELVAANPLSKVPSLRLDDGTALYDSAVICDYLDALGAGPRLTPAAGAERWTVMRRHALADGLMETTLLLALEVGRRPEHERSPHWIDHWCTTIRQTVAALEQEVSDFPDQLDIGQIATGCALAYLDLRASGHVVWRTGTRAWPRGSPASRNARRCDRPDPRRNQTTCLRRRLDCRRVVASRHGGRRVGFALGAGVAHEFLPAAGLTAAPRGRTTVRPAVARCLVDVAGACDP